MRYRLRQAKTRELSYLLVNYSGKVRVWDTPTNTSDTILYRLTDRFEQSLHILSAEIVDCKAAVQQR